MYPLCSVGNFHKIRNFISVLQHIKSVNIFLDSQEREKVIKFIGLKRSDRLILYFQGKNCIM